jgi:hypothetical protein
MISAIGMVSSVLVAVPTMVSYMVLLAMSTAPIIGLISFGFSKATRLFDEKRNDRSERSCGAGGSIKLAS